MLVYEFYQGSSFNLYSTKEICNPITIQSICVSAITCVRHKMVDRIVQTCYRNLFTVKLLLGTVREKETAYTNTPQIKKHNARKHHTVKMTKQCLGLVNIDWVNVHKPPALFCHYIHNKAADPICKNTDGLGHSTFACDGMGYSFKIKLNSEESNDTDCCMFVCLVAGHYLNQCWLIVDWNPVDKFQRNLNNKSTLVVCKFYGIYQI